MNIVGLLAGLIFGLGLVISGMANPQKVLNFLDVSGTWDPSLIFVMGGAIAVTLPGFAILRRRDKPILAPKFSWPDRTDIDARLMSGAVAFGTGWGLSGFCPGPALTAISMGAVGTYAFLPMMLVGMWIARTIARFGASAQAA